VLAVLLPIYNSLGTRQPIRPRAGMFRRKSETRHRSSSEVIGEEVLASVREFGFHYGCAGRADAPRAGSAESQNGGHTHCDCRCRHDRRRHPTDQSQSIMDGKFSHDLWIGRHVHHGDHDGHCHDAVDHRAPIERLDGIDRGSAAPAAAVPRVPRRETWKGEASAMAMLHSGCSRCAAQARQPVRPALRTRTTMLT
jgi:hypothetical protein